MRKKTFNLLVGKIYAFIKNGMAYTRERDIKKYI